MKLYVEGGGDVTLLKTECRNSFADFITKAGITKRPRIVACGGRQNAYESYCIAIKNGEAAFLLVDAEEPIKAAHQNGTPGGWKPWAHLKNRQGDNWDRPAGAKDTECHLMVQVMESWFIAERSTLRKFFGADFKDAKLPAAASKIEAISKEKVYASLKDATSLCNSKGKYGKGAHSFKILSEIAPATVLDNSPWASRFVNELKKIMDT